MNENSIYDAIVEVKNMIVEVQGACGLNVTVEEFITAALDEQWPARKSILMHVAAITVLTTGGFMAYTNDHTICQFYLPTTGDCINAFPYVMMRYRRGRQMQVRCWDYCGGYTYSWWIGTKTLKSSVVKRKKVA